MRKLKKLFALVLVFAILFSFAACGIKDSDRDDLDADRNDSEDRDDNNKNDKVNEKPDIAATVNGQDIDSIHMNYYLVDYVQNEYSQLHTSYGSNLNQYLLLMGIDVNKPLNEQYYDSQAKTTWADYYLQKALSKAQSDYALYSKAMDSAFRFSTEEQDKLNADLKNTFNTYADLLGYKNTDNYMEALYGKGASLKSYCKYATVSTIASAYYAQYKNALSYDDSAIRAYEKSNESKYAIYDTIPLANVRYLLIAFNGSTDADKTAARAEAERILQIWKTGDRTETSFIDLVAQHTDDTASKATGGLCEDIHPQSNYVPNFLRWATDPDRKQGDIEIVETEYGHLIMYFTGHGTLSYRDYMIREDMRNEDMDKWYHSIIDNTTAKLVSTKNLNLDIVMAGNGS